MPQAHLRVDLPNGPWIADVSREFPDAGFRVLTAVPRENEGFALVRVTAHDVDDVLDSMRDHETLENVSVMAIEDRIATVRVETNAPLLLLAAKRSGLPIEMPLDVEDGVAEVDVVGEHGRVSELGRQLDDLGLSFDVERIRQRVDPVRLLTDRQRELLLTAVELGYYDVPRQSTLTDVADHVGIAKSTCSELLQRVERSVIHEFVDDLPRDPTTGDRSTEPGREREVERESGVEYESESDPEYATDAERAADDGTPVTSES
mgnify:CR=1 FL=1